MRVHWAIFLVITGVLTPVCLPLGAAESPAPVVEADRDALIQRLKELWQVRRTEIQTADIRYRTFYSIEPKPPLTTEQLEQRIEEFGLRTSPKRAVEFLKAISGAFVRTDIKIRRLCLDGPRARFENGNTIKVHDADYLFQQDLANKTIFVNWTGVSNTPIPPIDWLREIPPESVLKVKDLVVTSSDSTIALAYDSTIEVKGVALASHADYQCDAASGIPSKDHYIIDGRPTETQYQLALVTSSEGVVFPSCLLRLSYQEDGPGGLIRGIDLTELIDAQFNRPIPQETFVMPKPKGFAVFDQRAGERLLGDTSQAVANAKSLVNPVLTFESKPKAVPWQRRAFFIVNGLLLIALGVWLWRRVSLKEPKH